MDDIQERLEHYEKKDRERRERERLKECMGDVRDKFLARVHELEETAKE